jgi:transposase
LSSTLVESLQQENAQLSARVADLSEQLDGVRRQLEWFKRQFFGRTSERRREFDDVAQASLFEALGMEVAPGAEAPTEQIRYERRKKCRDGALNEQGLRFDDSVPVETVVIIDAAVEAIPQAEREVVGEKVTHRLAQEPGSYKVIRYVRPVVKRRDTGQLVSAPAPANVLERSAVDVSFLAGMLVDKFRYHLPLHRQHQRLADCGIRVSRRSLTNWAGRAIDLLAPVVEAQSAHILTSRVLAMDETTIKAGRTQPGKMRTAYFWPVYGEADEVVFHYAPSRSHAHVETFLAGFRGTLLSDGYAAYEAYARRHALLHAQCWSHCRRAFIEAQDSEPDAVAEALKLIGVLYSQERAIAKKKLTGPAKLAHRREHSLPAVEAFFVWCKQQRQRPDLLPRNPLASALHYAVHREAGLRVFLEEPEVSIDRELYRKVTIRP